MSQYQYSDDGNDRAELSGVRRPRWSVVHNVLGLEVGEDETDAETEAASRPRQMTSHRIDLSSSSSGDAGDAGDAGDRSSPSIRSASREIRQLLIQSVAIVGLGAWTAAGVFAMLAAHRATHEDACWVMVP